jgi:hypothetical protein
MCRGAGRVLGLAWLALMRAFNGSESFDITATSKTIEENEPDESLMLASKAYHGRQFLSQTFKCGDSDIGI